MCRVDVALVTAVVVAVAGGCAGEFRGDPGSKQKQSITPGATYTLVRSGSGKCLDIAGDAAANGTQIQQYSCNGTEAQSFIANDVGGGAFRLVGVHSHKCIDVAAAGTADGTKVQLYDCNGTGAQSWLIEDMGAGYSRLRNTNSSKCLDVSGASNDDGALVQLWACNGTSAQSWQLNGGGTVMPPPPPPPPGGGGGQCSPSWTTTDACGGPVSGRTPDFGPNVIIFDPSMSSQAIQSQIDSVYGQQDRAEFGSGRFALLFKPGSYNNDVKVGFYTQVLGLGKSPDAVSISGAVRSKADYLGGNNATCNFWRGGENFSVMPTWSIDNNTNIWAISQGTQLRRIHVAGNLALSDNGWSSGGFVADSVIDGTIDSGSQQQFLTRNNSQHWQGRNWNMVFVGDSSSPGNGWGPGDPYTTVEQTPVVREKPFLYLDDNGNYLVMVPALKTNSQGHSWGNGAPPGSPLSIDRFYIAKPGDSAATLNGALQQGQSLLFTPGIYELDSSLEVTQANTVILGLGLATLHATNGTPLLKVADVDGVTIGGLLLEAGLNESPTLLELGPPGGRNDHASNPTAVFDLFCRAGGARAGSTKSCVTVNSSNVLLDNLWLWRADHGAGADWWSSRANNGIIVNGANVTAYGLFVEHFQQYQTLWNGNGGAVYLYQSEMPYDPPDQNSWNASGENGYPSYKVADHVTSHVARGIGVYSVFSNYVTASNAIESPNASGVSFSHLVSVSLASGQIANLYNWSGGSVGNGKMTSYSTF